MNKDNLVKTSALVCVSILAGAIITVAVQYLGNAEHTHRHGQKIASAESTDSTEQQSTESSDDAATASSDDGAQVTKTAPAGSAPNPALESAHPVSAALSLLNGNTTTSTAQTQETALAPGMHYSETSSGYPVYTGGRAVDSSMAPLTDSAQSQEVIYGQEVSNLQPQQIGRNGLLANPCMDPISVHGLAYSRHAN